MASKAGQLYLECAAISSELTEARFSGIVIETEDILTCRDRGVQINGLGTLSHPLLVHPVYISGLTRSIRALWGAGSKNQ